MLIKIKRIVLYDMKKQIAVIVAHPDDETLWTGGTLLSHPSWQVFIACLCGKTDLGKAEKFSRALAVFGAAGKIEDMDGHQQWPLPEKHIQQKVLHLLPHKAFDLVITHSPSGEYTRHRRHKEVGTAVIKLWHSGKIHTDKLWTFAHEDGDKTHYPRTITTANNCYILEQDTWQKKYKIITEIYGFKAESWEAQTTPMEEAFWQFTKPGEALKRLNNSGRKLNESIGII